MKFRIPFKFILFSAASAFMLTTIFFAATAEPQTTPREGDVQNAEREVTAGSGVVDFRTRHPDGNWMGGLGLVEPVAPETRVSSSQSGVIATLHVNEGDFVEANALLAELDSTTQRADLAVAEANQAVALADLDRARQGQRREEIEALRAELAEAEARAELSRSIMDRLEPLLAQGATTFDEVDRARRQAEVDAHAVEVVQARVRGSLRGRPEDIAAAEARLTASAAQVEQARTALAQREIRSPIAGEILEVKYRIGEFLAPGGAEPFLVMGDTRTLHARIDIDERDIASLRLGANAILIADAYPGREFQATVVEIARRMGRKNVRTDEPTERIDTKILEVVVAITDGQDLVPGQRVMGYIAAE